MNILIPIATLCLYVFSAQSTSFKMEESNFREEHFVKSGKPSASTSHDVVFAIKQKNIPEIMAENIFNSVKKDEKGAMAYIINFSI